MAPGQVLMQGGGWGLITPTVPHTTPPPAPSPWLCSEEGALPAPHPLQCNCHPVTLQRNFSREPAVTFGLDSLFLNRNERRE